MNNYLHKFSRYFPKTLLARLMMLIACLLVMAQLFTAQLFAYFEREPRAIAVALQAVTVVNYTRASLIASQDSLRLALLSELSGKEGVRVYYANLLEKIEPLPDDAFIQLVAQKIRDQLSPVTIVTMNHYGVEGLWVSFSIGVDDFWVVIPHPRIKRSFPWEWLGWSILILILSLGGAYFVTLRLNRPLNDLVKVAKQIQSGEPPSVIEECAITELREVIVAFNRMAESLADLDAERTLIIAGVSHDIRTPLARLRLAVELLKDKKNQPLKQSMIQDIADMDSIISQFLDFVRGSEHETVVVLSLNRLLNSLQERYARVGKTVTLLAMPDDTQDIFLAVRPLSLQRLLDNLIENAFTHGVSPVEIRFDTSDDKVNIHILDSGQGIPPEDIESVMRPFQRLNRARSNATGSGLGLAIAERIARLHHGKLVLLNRPQGGLDAKITLPIYRGGYRDGLSG